MPRTWDVAQLTVVALLAWGAYWAALPWIDCIRAFQAAGRRRDTAVGLIPSSWMER